MPLKLSLFFDFSLINQAQVNDKSACLLCLSTGQALLRLVKLTGYKWLNVSGEPASLRGKGDVNDERAVTTPLSLRIGTMKKKKRKKYKNEVQLNSDVISLFNYYENKW